MNAKIDQIKFSLLSPRSQLVCLDGKGNPLESDDVLFAMADLGGDSVYAAIPFPPALQSEISALADGETIWRQGVSVQLPGCQGVFDFAFSRQDGRIYWLIQDLSHAWNGRVAERWQPIPVQQTNRKPEGPVRILLAEDNPFNQKVTLRQLARLEFEAEAVGNGQEALEALAERHFDLVLMDLNMPVMNGYEAFQQIRSSLPAPQCDIPVVALSSSGLSAIDPGFDAILKKPAQSELLRQTITGILRSGAEASSGSAEPLLVRLDYLHEVTQSNREMMVELMDIYLQEVPAALASMQAHTENSEWRALRELAHKTKANFRYVGADRMFGLTDTIERYAASGGMVDQIPALMADLVELSGPTAVALRKERDEMGAGE